MLPFQVTTSPVVPFLSLCVPFSPHSAYSSILTIEEETLFEALMSTYQTVRRHIPEDRNPLSHYRKNLVSHIV
jgi:hypothetical protein